MKGCLGPIKEESEYNRLGNISVRGPYQSFWFSQFSIKVHFSDVSTQGLTLRSFALDAGHSLFNRGITFFWNLVEMYPHNSTTTYEVSTCKSMVSPAHLWDLKKLFWSGRKLFLQQAGQKQGLLHISECRVSVCEWFSVVSLLGFHWFHISSLKFAAAWVFPINFLWKISSRFHSIPHQCGIFLRYLGSE